MFKISRSIFRQTLAAFCCSIGPMTVGAIAGWSASAFPKIRNDELNFRLTLFQEAWVINTYYVGIMMGPLLAGIAMDAIGRKTTLLLFSIFSVANWTLVILASNEYMLYIARVFSGLWAGSVFTVCPAFLAEVLQPHVRGSLGSFLMSMYFLGNLYEYIIGPYVSYSTFGIASCIPCLIFAVAFLFIPESPYYYIMKNQRGKAEASLSWLRGDVDVNQELDAIETYAVAFMRNRGSFKDVFLNENYRAALINVQAIYFLQKLCGMFTVLAYLTVIIPPYVGPFTSENCTLIVGVVLWISTTLAASLMDRIGRKRLLVISNVGIIVTMTITGAWYYLDSTDLDLSETTYVPFLGLVIYGIFFCLGLGPIPTLYQGEILPSNIKARACTVTTMCSAWASILNTTLFAICIRYIGLYINFFLFAATSVFGLYFAKYHFTETSGKTLQEIQEELMKRRHRGKFTDDKKSPVNAKPTIYTVPMPNATEKVETKKHFEKDAKWTDE
nr:PREDICTED: facilitated trehalose transporter Tret1-like [Bemisia tabaci]